MFRIVREWRETLDGTEYPQVVFYEIETESGDRMFRRSDLKGTFAEIPRGMRYGSSPTGSERI